MGCEAGCSNAVAIVCTSTADRFRRLLSLVWPAYTNTLVWPVAGTGQDLAVGRLARTFSALRCGSASLAACPAQLEWRQSLPACPRVQRQRTHPRQRLVQGGGCFYIEAEVCSSDLPEQQSFVSTFGVSSVPISDEVSDVLSPYGSALDMEANTRFSEKVGLISVFDPMLGRPLQNTRLSLSQAPAPSLFLSQAPSLFDSLWGDSLACAADMSALSTM